MKNTLFCLVLFLLANLDLGAQDKYGYLNFGNLISSMPETKQADSDLEAYQKQLIAKGEEMAKAFQVKVDSFYARAQTGTLTPIQQQEEQKVLQAEQQKILAYEQEVVQKVQAKRQELLKPIIDRASATIKEFGTSNGYKMIFDSSIPNAMLFLDEAFDVTPQIKAKLGIN